MDKQELISRIVEMDIELKKLRKFYNTVVEIAAAPFVNTNTVRYVHVTDIECALANIDPEWWQKVSGENYDKTLD